MLSVALLFIVMLYVVTLNLLMVIVVVPQKPSSVKILVFACSAAEPIQTEKGPVLQNFLL